jgi:hypothetical protein
VTFYFGVIILGLATGLSTVSNLSLSVDVGLFLQQAKRQLPLVERAAANEV